MRYLKRCYTKRMQYYLTKEMIEFESEETIHCVRMTIQRKRNTQHYTMLKT